MSIGEGPGHDQCYLGSRVLQYAIDLTFHDSLVFLTNLLVTEGSSTILRLMLDFSDVDLSEPSSLATRKAQSPGG